MLVSKWFIIYQIAGNGILRTYLNEPSMVVNLWPPPAIKPCCGMMPGWIVLMTQVDELMSWGGLCTGYSGYMSPQN